MKFLIATLPVASLIASAVAVPAEPPDHHVFPRGEDAKLCGFYTLSGDKDLSHQPGGTLRPSLWKCSTLPKGLGFDSCVNAGCGICVMFT